MSTPWPLKGRSLAVVDDFSVDEQRYLYEQTREFKKRWLNREDVEKFRIRNPEISVYCMFLEDSTRTKESFRNAVNFHEIKLNMFDAASSSFNKSESLMDTVKMLIGYNRQSIFILRSKMEGVCRALEEHLSEYAIKGRREAPVFINGGDGRHEHPTQEFLDEFTFLEQHSPPEQGSLDYSHIHLALIGDLRHGRTIHSKVDGLKVFKSVIVDLVAPEDLALPDSYIDRMKSNQFDVRVWGSIEEYLSSGAVSDCWYFTRLQLERMGDEVREKEDRLRKAVTFSKDWIGQLPENTRFYHPLPRHREKPVIQPFLDTYPLNGWDGQSVNGYYIRVVLLSMLAGRLGQDFQGKGLEREQRDPKFVRDIKLPSNPKAKAHFNVGIKPVDNGTVIDHIAKGHSIKGIWDCIDKIRRIFGLNCIGSHGVFPSGTSDRFFDPCYKGIISLPDVMELKEFERRKLAAVSPGCTVNLIKKKAVRSKYRLDMPPEIYKFPESSCKNSDCITWPGAYQHILPKFYHRDEKFICHYCGRAHDYTDIWDI